MHCRCLGWFVNTSHPNLLCCLTNLNAVIVIDPMNTGWHLLEQP